MAKEKSWFGKHPVLTVVICFILLSLIVSPFLPDDTNSDINSAANTTQNSNPNIQETTATQESSLNIREETFDNEIDNDDKTYNVTRVIDGDTIEISTGERVRLICIDTPETYEEGYEKAKDYLEDLILGEEVFLVKDVSETDRYDRLLRYVYTEDNEFVNELIVKKG